MSDILDSPQEEEEIPKGYVASTSEILASKQADAEGSIPEGMELAGWMLDGWVSAYPLLSDSAVPVYRFTPLTVFLFL